MMWLMGSVIFPLTTSITDTNQVIFKRHSPGNLIANIIVTITIISSSTVQIMILWHVGGVVRPWMWLLVW